MVPTEACAAVQVLLGLTEQALAMGAEKARLMEALQRRSWEVEQVMRDRDQRLDQARRDSRDAQLAIQQVLVPAGATHVCLCVVST